MEPALHRPQTLKPRRKSGERSGKRLSIILARSLITCNLELAMVHIKGFAVLGGVRLFEWKDKEEKKKKKFSSSVGRDLKVGAERGAPGNLSGDCAALDKGPSSTFILSVMP